MSKKQPQKYFSTHLVSYITLIVLVLCTLIPYISNTLRALDRQAEEKLQASLEQTLDHLDDTLSNIESMLVGNENDIFSALYRLDNKIRSSDYYTMRRATQYIRTIVSSNPAISDLLITYPASGITLHAKGGFDSVEAVDLYYRPGFYHDIFLQKRAPFYVPSQSVIYSVTRIAEDVFGYCFNLTMSGRAKCFIVIKTQSYLSDEMFQTLSGEGYASLSDYKGNQIHTIGTAPESALRNHITVHCTSKGGRFMLSASLPRIAFSGTRVKILTMLIGCLLASLAIGSIYAMLLARHHAKPLEGLILQLNQYNQQIRANKTRMAAMQHAITSLKHENEIFSQQMDQFRKIRYENAVTRLFTAANLSRADLDYLDDSCGKLPRRFVVGYGKLKQSAIEEEYTDAMSLIFSSMIRQNLPNECLIYLLDARSVAVLLGEDMVRERAELVDAFPDILWSFSRVYEGIRFVASALDEAHMTHQFRRNSAMSMQAAQRVYQCVIAGYVSELESQLAEIFNAVDQENIRYVYDGLRFVIRTVASELGCSAAVAPFSRTVSCDELCNRLVETLRAQCEEIHARKKSRNEERKRQVLDFIHANYTDSGLYAPSIAEQVGISEKYLYNFVKEQTGYSLGDYLQKLRMEKATELLSGRAMSIKDICFAVGFNSENSFYKAFKRMYGMTPSLYRTSSLNHKCE